MPIGDYSAVGFLTKFVKALAIKHQLPKSCAGNIQELRPGLNPEPCPWNANEVKPSLLCGCGCSDPKTTIDGWKAVAEELNSAADHLDASDLKVGYHNHEPKFTPLAGVRPIANYRQKHKVIDYAATRCWHLFESWVGSDSLDTRQSGTNPLSSLERLVFRSDERV